MSIKNLFLNASWLSIGLALVVLSGCGKSDPPAKTPAAAPVATNNHVPKLTDDTAAPSTSPSDAQVNAEQVPYVAPPATGSVDFGPAAPNSGLDPAGDAEHAAYMAIREKQADELQKQQHAAAQQSAVKPAPPQTANNHTKRQ